MDEKLRAKLKRVQALFFDVDGTLTNGRIIYDKNGNELKSFFVRDGSRITLALKAGLKVYFITSRVSEAVRKRAEERKIHGVLSKNDLKTPAALSDAAGVESDEILYLGDDINDIPFLKEAGVKVAVSDAASEVKEIAEYVTNARGGYGAAAEIIEMALRAQGKWDTVLES